MAAPNSNQVEEEFVEAKTNWELEKLYVDLASSKGKALTPVEKKFLRGLLCGCSPAEIASIVYQSRSSSTVRVYLSNGLYKYIEEMLSNAAGYAVKVKNWSRVTYLLEKAGYKKTKFQLPAEIIPITPQKAKDPEVVKIKSTSIQDWGEAIDVSVFQGRTAELAKTQQWILQEDCRLLLLLGMGGIGKTAFSVKLAQEIQDQFDYVIWRSLRLSPSPGQIIEQLIQILLPTPETVVAETLEGRISQLINFLRNARCLIIFDNFEAILASGDNDATFTASHPRSKNVISPFPLTQIQYRSGYELYGELIRRVGESQHQSCLLLTSREKPTEIAALEGNTLPVHCLRLTGLNKSDSLSILKFKGLANISEDKCRILLEKYAGNPLFLKLVATTIQELFDGNIDDFIAQGTVVFGEMRAILDQQFNRLSQLEKHMMYWLAMNQNAVAVRQLQKNLIPGLSPRLSQRLILEAVDLLHRRSLIEKQACSFSQTPVLTEYIIERLIEENLKLSEEQESYFLMSQTIFAAHLQNHIPEIRLSAEI
ncbi:NACHT domain-containing protein [Nostoc sp. FACHB-152]|uniref:NB-ARC domain-containing protein n=1 Tax=unclassified Nostoc TaxID=2593658 RepID=UPI001681DE09|nr:MULTISPECIES: NB-ARC domain-containing protein [unclassified Nostoc]MBD2449458.1 NACHT domain-containing protein [Nostoc sp. FACHB-152]MBD2470777.1 NACHT domain-containing protein [Nostoc sp. FACHB-145]